MEKTPDYQTSLTPSHRKRHGVFYTPSSFVEFILDRVLEPVLSACKNINQILNVKVCDPSCGTGGFLIAAHERFLRHVARVGAAGEIISSIQQSCLYGVDLDGGAIALAKSQIPFANLFCANALRDRDVLKKDFFDVVIGNPPYGMKIDAAERVHYMRLFDVRDRDSASFFMCLALEIAKPGGTTGFIVPKSFIYSSSFSDVKARLTSGITELVDCGMAWKNVKLEQVIYVHQKDVVAPNYLSLKRTAQSIDPIGLVSKDDASLFGGLLPALTADEIELGKILRSSSLFLTDVAQNQRGAGLQKKLDGGLAISGATLNVIGGRHLARYGWTNVSRSKISRASIADKKAFVHSDSILVQNIVAHLQNPKPHLKITAQLVDAKTSDSLVILDTVNQLKCHEGYSSRVLLAVLNSKLISWYIYRFIVGQAVRTIHFDAPLISRIPVPRPSSTAELDALVDQMLRQPEPVLDDRLESLVWDLFGVGGRGTARTVGVRGLGV